MPLLNKTPIVQGVPGKMEETHSRPTIPTNDQYLCVPLSDLMDTLASLSKFDNPDSEVLGHSQAARNRIKVIEKLIGDYSDLTLTVDEVEGVLSRRETLEQERQQQRYQENLDAATLNANRG
jgi:hypothetical protein